MKPATLTRGPLGLLVLPLPLLLVLGCVGGPAESEPAPAAVSQAPEPTAPQLPTPPARRVAPGPVKPVPAY